MEDKEKKFPPKFPPEFPLEFPESEGSREPPNPLSFLKDMVRKIEEAKKTIEVTAKGLDTVGNLDADTLMEEGLPSPKELLFRGKKEAKKEKGETKTPDKVAELTEQSIHYMEKAIEDHDMEALQKAIEYNPCGICRKTLKKIGNEALSKEDIIKKLKGEAEIIKRASRIYQKRKEHPEKSMEEIKKEVNEEF